MTILSEVSDENKLKDETSNISNGVLISVHNHSKTEANGCNNVSQVNNRLAIVALFISTYRWSRDVLQLAYDKTTFNFTFLEFCKHAQT